MEDAVQTWNGKSNDKQIGGTTATSTKEQITISGKENNRKQNQFNTTTKQQAHNTLNNNNRTTVTLFIMNNDIINSNDGGMNNDITNSNDGGRNNDGGMNNDGGIDNYNEDETKEDKTNENNGNNAGNNGEGYTAVYTSNSSFTGAPITLLIRCQDEAAYQKWLSEVNALKEASELNGRDYARWSSWVRWVRSFISRYGRECTPDDILEALDDAVRSLNL